ncbi:MAG: transcriptional regulator, TetR family [Solirubrobacterales bacterium]|nr:transcriptional regulator, TetR family [Solirubrobacterales bacterium]
MSSPRYTRLEADERRGQILAAAREAFARAGLAGTSMAEIAGAAGVTRGLLNHYFGTKRVLYLAVVDELASELGNLVRTDAGDLPIEELVELNATSWLDSVERNRELWRAVLGVEAIGADSEVEAIMGAARDEVIERMAANQGSGAPTDELRLVLRVYLGAAEAGAREWALRGRATREQVHAVLVGTLLAMVGTVLPRVPPSP